jgi:hypothetical protein
MMCVDCKHWDIGNYWSTGSHGLTIESKGWCLVKKNKRKRWNYCPACKLFERKQKIGFIYQGGNKPIEEDLANICRLIEEIIPKENKL